jgi:hypothetical protein
MPERVAIPLRVEVAPIGYYLDRIIEPIQEHHADRVYIIRAKDGSEDRAREFRRRVVRALLKWKPTLDIRVVSTELWSLEDSVEVFSAILRSEIDAGNSVAVNLSTGSKIEAIGGAIACMAHGGTPYYVRMRSYDQPDVTSPLATGVKAIDAVQLYGFTPPTAPGIAVLESLEENQKGLAKKSLISLLTEKGLIPKDIPGKSIQAKYARLQSILDKLEEEPAMISVEGSRRAARVRLTPRGRLALRIFHPRLGLLNKNPGADS